jgi:hypothetical protein
MGALSGLLVLCRNRGSTRLRGAGVLIALAGLGFVMVAIRDATIEPRFSAMTVRESR